MAQEKNVAAFMDDDAHTIRVKTLQTEREAIYVTNLPLVEGDFVVVPAMAKEGSWPFTEDDDKRLVIAKVVKADEEMGIEPNADQQYLWVVSKIDLTYYNDLMARNKEIQVVVNNMYKANAKNAFKNMVLSGVQDAAQRDKLLALLDKPTQIK